MNVSKSIIVTSVGAIIFGVGALYSQEIPPVAGTQATTVSQQDVDDQNKVSAPKFATSKTGMLDKWRKEVLTSYKLTEGVDKKGRFCVFAQAPVSRKPTDPEYGSAVTIAFNDAMLRAQQNMVMQRFGQIFVKSMRETFVDQSSNAKLFDELDEMARKNHAGDFAAQAQRIIEKKLILEEAKLDQELIRNGIDPNDINSKPLIEKKSLFFSSMTRTTMKRAMGEISGLVPIASAVMKDEKGNTSVGVILMMSSKTVQVARDISLGRASLVKGKGKNLEEMIPKTPDQWVGQLGLRFIYDHNGCPTLVSYGSGSYVPSGDDYIDAELETDAWEEATDNADAQIAEFVNGYMSAESERITGQQVDRFIMRELKPGAKTIEQTVKDLVKKSSENAQSYAKMSMQGIAPLERQMITLPSGQTMCYVIRTWSYDAFNAVDNLNNNVTASQDTTSGGASAQAKDEVDEEAAKYEGFLTNDLDDF